MIQLSIKLKNFWRIFYKSPEQLIITGKRFFFLNFSVLYILLVNFCFVRSFVRSLVRFSFFRIFSYFFGSPLTGSFSVFSMTFRLLFDLCQPLAVSLALWQILGLVELVILFWKEANGIAPAVDLPSALMWSSSVTTWIETVCPTLPAFRRFSSLFLLHLFSLSRLLENRGS